MLSTAAGDCSPSRRVVRGRKDQHQVELWKEYACVNLDPSKRPSESEDDLGERSFFFVKTVLSYICLAILAIIIGFVAFRFLYPYVVYDVDENVKIATSNHVSHKSFTPGVIFVSKDNDHSSSSSSKSSDSSGSSDSSSRSSVDVDDVPPFEKKPEEKSIEPEITVEEILTDEKEILIDEKEILTDENVDVQAVEEHHCFLRNPAHLCSTEEETNVGGVDELLAKKKNVKMLILVTSDINHFEQRKAIRETWGAVAKKPKGPVRLGFVVGTSLNQTVMKNVETESDLYKDIIQVDVDDASSVNKTFKSVSMLCWVANYCPDSSYFLKVNDDVFTNVGLMVSTVVQDPFRSKTDFIGGYILNGGVPEKDDEDLVVVEEGLLLDVYPSYASGSAYVTRGNTASKLYDTCRMKKPLIPEEDVFVTGLCAQDLGAQLLHSDRFIVDYDAGVPTWGAWKDFAAAHPASPDDLRRIWSEMLSDYALTKQAKTEV